MNDSLYTSWMFVDSQWKPLMTITATHLVMSFQYKIKIFKCLFKKTGSIQFLKTSMYKMLSCTATKCTIAL